MLELIHSYRQKWADYLKQEMQSEAPENLFEPIIYIMGLGGKRLRPVLTLIGHDIFNSEYERALDASMAVEIFHNFSLVHDDIMDRAPLRRGKATVHEKWDVNSGILSGDAMLIQAYSFLERYEAPLLKPLIILFNRTAMEVCKGQQYDVDFEIRDDVTIVEYLLMIRYKTAVLLACGLQMGAMVAGASEVDQQLLYQCGINLGLAFQLQDDYLDAFGDPETFGKQIGGDIIENKKTYLYLKSLELGSPGEAQELQELFSIKPKDPTEKIARVKYLFEKSGGKQQARNLISTYTEAAMKDLDGLSASKEKTATLRNLALELLEREL